MSEMRVFCLIACVCGVLAPQLAVAQFQITSLGCFKDFSSRVLVKQGPQTLQTLDSCAALAVANFYPYFGLEYGGQCWYGPSLTAEVPSTSCTMPCAGNPHQSCGGAYAINVYQVTPKPAIVPSTSYVGCLQDYSARILPQQGSQLDSTVQTCAATAVNNYYTYFGLEYGGECWFGSALGTSTPSSNCTLACTAAPNQRCGGAYAIDVYAVSATPANVPYSTYLGCYVDATSRSVPNSGPQTGATAESCAILAAKNGAKYFGLKSGGQCYYGSAMSTNVTSTNCNMGCTAANSERCGGAHAIDVWSLSL